MIFGPKDDKADVHIIRGGGEDPYIIKNVKLNEIIKLTNTYKKESSDDKKHLYPKY